MEKLHDFQRGERLDWEKFKLLSKFEVVRRLGVSYRIDGQNTHPGAHYGEVELRAYRQSPAYTVYKTSDSSWFQDGKTVYWGDWKEDVGLRK